MTVTATDWLARIRALPLPERIKVMNVCGGHERSITMAGLLRPLLPGYAGLSCQSGNVRGASASPA